jgi:hypothetical protein
MRFSSDCRFKHPENSRWYIFLSDSIFSYS